MRTLVLGLLLMMPACSGGVAPMAPPADLGSLPGADLAFGDLATDPAHGPLDFSGVSFDGYSETMHGSDPHPDASNLVDGGKYLLPDGGTFRLPDLAQPPNDLTPTASDLAVSDLSA